MSVDIQAGCTGFGRTDLDPHTRRAAALTTARHAHNHDDLAQLLDTLGLNDPPPTQETQP